jgi:glycogen debranching enzyme
MRLYVCAVALSCCAGSLDISRPVRTWEFLDATGPRAAWLGREDGTLEAYVYPLKILRDLRLRFESNGHLVPGEGLARRVSYRPASSSITYTGDDFRVVETLAVPADKAGALMVLDIEARNPLRIDVEFTADFQLMWPASMGTAGVEWSPQAKGFVFGADGQPFSAVFGSPDATVGSLAYATNYTASSSSSFSVGTITGHAQRVVGIAASMKSRDEALSTYKSLVAEPQRAIDEAGRHYADYLANTVTLDLPDARLQKAYDWSRISTVKGFVDNPFLGRGLVAGYGLSKGAYRPGFAWFFGRDSFWTSFALTSVGDFANARAAIGFVSHFQREDGRIPHEISQSASLVDWFHQFPYGYASADATPLFAIAVGDYVQASGDIAFAREQAPRLWKALDFMRSTLDDTGFPGNLGVGHGWVEGGPLLPVRVELYQAGCYVEALRSLAALARLLNDDARARQLTAEYEQERQVLNERFWLPESHRYAFALDVQGHPVDQPSVLATVPMWFDLLDRRHAQEMIDQLSEEQHASDWGMRIISSRSTLYDPSGYHFGSVWPLFTGWAATGEYRNHQADAALANLRANAWLALDGSGGNTTEVLAGDWYSPLSTASPHQIWSSAMVVSPLLRGLLGLESDAPARKMRFAPHLPADWQRVGVQGIPFAGARVDLRLRRDANVLTLEIVNAGAGSFTLDFAPAYPLCARLTAADVDGKAVTWTEESEYKDWHPHFALPVGPGRTTLTIHHRGLFGYALPFAPPHLGEPDQSLKIVSTRWTNDAHTLTLTVSGRPSRDYRLNLVNSEQLIGVDGASRGDNGELTVHMPAGANGEYVNQQIVFSLR